MASGLCWIHLWIVVLLRRISADSRPRYTINNSPATFDQAKQRCSEVGVLTTIPTKQEINDIFGHISDSEPRHFWIGLKKDKDACVVPNEPLRGFKWTEVGSKDSDLIRWAKEPQETCASVLCAALELNVSAMSWGLISGSCRQRNQFICRLRDGPTTNDRETDIKTTTLDPEPATSVPKTETPEPSKPATQKPESAAPEHEVPTEREPKTDLKPTIEPELVGPDPGPDSCKHPVIPEARSLSPDSDNKIQVECWSKDLLELQCGGRPVTWRLPDDSPANFTTICQRCKSGYKKNASANCVDIDECSSGTARCKHTCLNTGGSFRCVCTDESGKHHEEGSPACPDPLTVEDNDPLSGILIPVLVAVAALVVLVLVVAVTVKCCLMRRSKKKRAEKMAMKSKGSFHHSQWKDSKIREQEFSLKYFEILVKSDSEIQQQYFTMSWNLPGNKRDSLSSLADFSKV